MTPIRRTVAAALCGLATIATTSLTAAQSRPAASQPAGPVEIERLGGPNAFHKPPLQSVADLQQAFAANRADIEAVLAKAGWPGKPADLFAAVAAGKVRETAFPVDGTMPWMALRRKDGPDVVRDAVWKGKEPFPAYELTFVSGDYRYRFLVPKPCTNLVYLDSEKLPPPVAKLSVTPRTDCITRPMTIDASGSSVSDGRRITAVEVEMTRPDGRKESLGRPAGPGWRWQRAFDEPGTYRFTAVAVANTGSRSKPATAQVERTPCPPTAALRLSHTERLTNEPFTVDTSGSTTQVGELDMVVVTVTDADGTTVRELEMKSPYITELKLEEPGFYTFTAVAVDSLGQRSAPVSATIEIVSRWSVLTDVMAGLERRWREEFPRDRSAPLVGGKAGPAYLIRRNVELAAAVGVAFNTRDTDNTSLYADVELNWLGDRGLFGVGVGLWDFTHSDTITGDLLIHGGVNLPWKTGRYPVAWLIEGRLFFDHADMPDNNYLVWTGLRFHF